MDDVSKILYKITSDSESTQPEEIPDEDRDGIAIDAASTEEQTSLESQTATIAEACRLAEEHLRSHFISRFLQLIHESEFEFGFNTPADDYVRDALMSYGSFAREWISDLFLQNFDSPFVTSAILRVITHFDYQQMYPQGMTMAAAATSHKDAEVRECGVRCFEGWEAPESITILRNLSFDEDWLNEYLTDVISELEDLVEHVDRR